MLPLFQHFLSCGIRRLQFGSLGIGLCLFGWLPLTAAAAELPYQVGVATADITPDRPMMLNGYAAREGALVARVEQPITARAMVIESSDAPPVVLVSIELCGVPRSLTARIAAAVEQRHGIPRARIALCTTHTHSAPMIHGLLENIVSRPLTADEQRVIDRYTDVVFEQTVAAVDAALRDRKPARLSWGISRVGFARNRRSGEGPVDHQLPVLVAHDAQDQPLGIVAGYACHCTTLGPVPFISGDWAGCAVEAIEADFPGATALMLIGGGGDQNPHPSGAAEQAVARLHGRALADAVRQQIHAGLQPVTGELQVTMEEIELALQAVPDRKTWQQRAAGSGIIAHHASQQLARLDRGEPLPSSVSYPVQSWVFGDDLAMTFLGGEVVVDYSLALKATHGPKLWVTAYANDVACYIPSERVLGGGGYEADTSMLWYGLPAPLAPGLQAQIEAAVAAQLPDEFRAEPAGNPSSAGSEDPARTGGKLPLSPAESIARMRIHGNLRIELVAAEPLVVDPVAIDFAADGRLWVAEMRDYPEGLDGRYQPGGRIRLLSDSDRDGRYDRAETFLDGIPFPTGLMAWREGVLVAAAPDLFFAEDTNGDGRADRRSNVLTGFATHNYQARVNSLTLGLDNWIHAAGGLFGGELQASAGERVDATNRDVRLLPDQGIAEAVTGRTQQGRVRDDWGHWFGCTNSVVLSHYPHRAHYLRRNPLLVPPAPERYVPRGDDSRQLFPRGELVQFSKSGPSGRPTSVCGLGIYRDHRLGSEYYGNAFVCEPVNQLVHRLVLSPMGVTFEGRRAADEQDREFLTSTDNWFRPVQVRTGPDGALWVVDMYRYVIEHPRFISDEVRSRIDLRSGDRQGRIYRILPRESTAAAAEWPRGGLSPSATKDAPSGRVPLDALLAALASPNGTVRDLAHTELLWRREAAAVEPLRKLARSSELPQVRLQTLCVLDGLDAAATADVLAALDDPHPAVRAHAVRLSEGLPAVLSDTPASPGKTVRGKLQQMLTAEADANVRLQLAYTVGEWPTAEKLSAVLELIQQDGTDADLRAASFSGLAADELNPLVTELLQMAASPGSQIAVDELVSMIAASGDNPRIVSTTAEILRSEIAADRQLGLLPRLLHSTEPRELQRSPDAVARLEPLRKLARLHLTQAATAAAPATEAPPISEELLAAATAFSSAVLRWPDTEGELRALTAMLSPQQPAKHQMLAVGALGRSESSQAHDALLSRWDALTPTLRAQAFDGLMTRLSGTERLLAALEQGTIRGSQLDSAQQQTLAEHPDQAIRQRAAAVLSVASRPHRDDVLSRYRNLKLSGGDLQNGAVIFEQQCAACHRLGGTGRQVGPDLAALSDRSTDFLLAEILDPNRAVDGRYATYVAVTEDGRIASGILSAEQDGSITLQSQQGETTLRRGEIAELSNRGLSLMPEGLERLLPPEAMRDLLAYLQAAGK